MKKVDRSLQGEFGQAAEIDERIGLVVTDRGIGADSEALRRR